MQFLYPRQGPEARPRVEIWYELETRCNLHCKFCFNYWKEGDTRAPRRLPTAETLEGLTRLLDAVACEKLTISGGEPLLREDLFDILALVKSRGIPMVLTTNGTLLDAAMIDRLRGAGVVTFQLPFHSADRARHDFISGGECWRQTLRAFISLREAGANTLAVFVATKLNLKDFCGVLEVCAALGLREVIFNRFIPSGLGVRYRDVIGVPEDGELLPVLYEANERAERLGLQIHLGVPVELPPEARKSLTRVTTASCPVREGQTRWTLDAECNIRRCNHSGKSVGNILNGGLEVLLAELRTAPAAPAGAGETRCCQFLEPTRLYQISVR
jgi:MoaA/NifB/PqqE/SkfB family radical SAM enzyme